MAEVRSGLWTALLVGAVIGLLIAIMRYGVDVWTDILIHSRKFDDMVILGIAVTVFVVLGGLLCGYIVAARTTGAKSLRSMYRDAMISGAVAGLFIWLGLALYYYLQKPEYWIYHVPYIVLYGIYHLVMFVILSLAGTAIFSAAAGKARHFAIDEWPVAIGVGLAAAFAVVLSYFVQLIAGQIYVVLSNHGNLEDLIMRFTFDGCTMIIGVMAGVATAALMRRSASSPAHYLPATALAGLIAGLFGFTAHTFLFEVIPQLEFLPEIISRQWLHTISPTFYGAVTLTVMAIGGGAIYALYRYDIKFLSGGAPGTGKTAIDQDALDGSS